VDAQLDNLHVKRIGIKDLVGYVYIVRVDVGLGVIPSAMSISSKGSVDEKPCPNFSASSKSSMTSPISVVID
jgi:hypothetical protein